MKEASLKIVSPLLLKSILIPTRIADRVEALAPTERFTTSFACHGASGERATIKPGPGHYKLPDLSDRSARRCVRAREGWSSAREGSQLRWFKGGRNWKTCSSGSQVPQVSRFYKLNGAHHLHKKHPFVEKRDHYLPHHLVYFAIYLYGANHMP